MRLIDTALGIIIFALRFLNLAYQHINQILQYGSVLCLWELFFGIVEELLKLTIQEHQ